MIRLLRAQLASATAALSSAQVARDSIIASLHQSELTIGKYEHLIRDLHKQLGELADYAEVWDEATLESLTTLGIAIPIDAMRKAMDEGKTIRVSRLSGGSLEGVAALRLALDIQLGKGE